MKRKKLGAIVFMASLGFTAFAMTSEPNYRSMKYTPRSQEEAIAWQKELRAKLFHILKLDELIALKTPIPFEAKTLLSEDKGKYTKQELEINSTAGRRISLIVTLPQKSDSPCPAVVCVHGHGGSRAIVYDASSIYKGFATSLAENGFVTISTEVGQHEVYEKNRILMGERLWDLIRCVDYLESLQEVDKKRIGCAGLSLGGEMTMWLAAMDERIKAAVSAGFLTVMDQMEQNHCLCWKFEGLRELVDFADIYSLIAPRFLLCQNGLKEGPKDFYVPIARDAMQEIKQIFQDFGQPYRAILDVHPGGHEINLPVLMAFFERNLK
ncbi:MAG: alpha/beta hydrolase family protein [Candidatus Omnitrophota bacterium]